MKGLSKVVGLHDVGWVWTEWSVRKNANLKLPVRLSKSQSVKPT